MTVKRRIVGGLMALAFSGSAFAESAASGPAGKSDGQDRPQPSPQMFQALKAMELKILQARMQNLEQAQTCVQSAVDVGQLKKCREQEREAQTQLREQMKKDMELMRNQRKGLQGQGPAQQ